MSRINLYGAAGAGKSRLASWLFWALKNENYSIELVTEFCKSFAVQQREIKKFDQILLMGKQVNYEYRFLAYGVKNIVTDSPVLLSAFYTRSYYPELDMPDHMEAIAMEYEKSHPSINVFLDRAEKPYFTEGRYQTKEEAVHMDGMIKDSLDRLKIEYKTFHYDDKEAILNYIKERID